MSVTRVLILGVGGQFGRLLVDRLDPSLTVAGVDRLPADSAPNLSGCYLEADLQRPDEKLRALLRETHAVISALPEEPTLFLIEQLLGDLQPGTLVVDILSVKQAVVAAMTAARKDLEFLSLHPMFASSVGFKDQNVVVVEVRPGLRSQQLTQWLEQWGSRLAFMSAEEHDVSTALIQAATHAAVLAFGLCLRSFPYDVEKAVRISTPPHRTLLAMLARILAADPDVYWKIQTSNPQAEAARRALTAGCERLQEVIREGTSEEFKELLSGLQQMVAPQLDPLSQLGQELFVRGREFDPRGLAPASRGPG